MLAINCDSFNNPKSTMDDELMRWAEEQLCKAKEDICLQKTEKTVLFYQIKGIKQYFTFDLYSLYPSSSFSRRASSFLILLAIIKG